jgi:F0F1-type ATP synthase membrane subunit b/b'
MVERDAVAQAAQARAEQIIADARASIDNIRSDADNYALEVLTRLEMEMDRSLTQVRNGITALQGGKGG